MSPLTEALIINGAVLISVLEGDLGPHRKIGKFRILRPLLTIAIVIPIFIDSPVTHGNGLLVELAGLAAGLFCGLIAIALMRVYRSPRTGRPVSAAGFPYAMLWIVVVGALMVVAPWPWLLASTLWPLAWIEWQRLSIRRKLPVAQWPKHLYL